MRRGSEALRFAVLFAALLGLAAPAGQAVPGMPGELRAEQSRAEGLARTAAQLLRAGRTNESLPYLRKLLELQPHNDNARYALALALLFPPQAPDSDPGGLSRARLLESARLLSECLERARGVSETGAFVAGRMFYLGLAHWWLGNPDQALGLFEQSYQADPARLDALYNRFAIYEELGRETEAAVELKRLDRLSETGQ
ncbi:MAG: tetratricopeptide repeat protein [bacterium]|nr:tetratricopeptide repeat protein [bacterium]